MWRPSRGGTCMRKIRATWVIWRLPLSGADAREIRATWVMWRRPLGGTCIGQIRATWVMWRRFLSGAGAREIRATWVMWRRPLGVSGLSELHRWCEAETGWDLQPRDQGYMGKNIDKHTAHTIASWPNPKRWILIHTSDLMMITRQSILSIITKDMGKLKTHRPIFCIIDNERICLILFTHLTNISDRHTNKRVRSENQNVSEYLHSS